MENKHKKCLALMKTARKYSSFCQN
jgi:hypothetical protein